MINYILAAWDMFLCMRLGKWLLREARHYRQHVCDRRGHRWGEWTSKFGFEDILDRRECAYCGEHAERYLHGRKQ